VSSSGIAFVGPVFAWSYATDESNGNTSDDASHAANHSREIDVDCR
jgi:hypothetical protein